MEDALLAEIVRGEIVESCHRGALVLLDADGSVRVAAGDISAPMYPRSSLKPLQAAALVRMGLVLEPRLLALVAASHSGGAWHVAGVEEILAGCGCTTEALQCISGLPLGSAERDAYVREGGQSDRIHFNCSGKHAGFIATCVCNGWDTDTYLEAEHPMQVQVRALIEQHCGEQVYCTTIDGCGAPLFAVSLHGLARGFRAIAVAPGTSPEGAVADAMRAYPEMVGGIGRDDTIAMQVMPGLIAKMGAEGVLCMAMPDGRTCVIKVSDGAPRGYQPVMRAVLRFWGLADDAVEMVPLTPVLGGGNPMGVVRLASALVEALAS